MQKEKKVAPEQIVTVIEDSLEERKGRDRRKPKSVDPFLNASLERRKGGDRRDRRAKQSGQD